MIPCRSDYERHRAVLVAAQVRRLLNTGALNLQVLGRIGRGQGASLAGAGAPKPALETRVTSLHSSRPLGRIGRVSF